MSNTLTETRVKVLVNDLLADYNRVKNNPAESDKYANEAHAYRQAIIRIKARLLSDFGDEFVPYEI